ncbi:MAG: porin family protein, partial [Melioribacteraceae bacterium]
MKKIISITLAFFFAASIFTQNYSQSFNLNNKLCFGFKAGLNYSNVYDSEGEEFDSDATIGFVVGGFLTIPIGDYLGVHPEILFSQKGFNATGKILGAKYEISRTTNYIDIPILFAFKPNEHLSILLGPQYSYLLKQIDTFEN